MATAEFDFKLMPGKKNIPVNSQKCGKYTRYLQTTNKSKEKSQENK